MAAKRSILKILGPGLLYAGAAVGVSHLVQSTKAGAFFGFGLLWAVVAANLVKFPFFSFGPRYAAATGKSLLHGYKRIGNWTLVVFVIMTVLTMFVIQAAVTIVCAGLASEMTGLELPLWVISAGILVLCMAILLRGQYKLLDRLMKVIIIILSITTVVALVQALSADVLLTNPMVEFDVANDLHLAFLIALMGWMPAPLDISVWHSVWSTAKSKTDGVKTTMKEAMLDFKVGYWGTTLLALGFVALGALMIYRTGTPIPKSANLFAKELIGAYTKALGNWAYWPIAIAAFTTMFSTTLTCLDAFPRVLTPAVQLLRNEPEETTGQRRWYWIWISITVAGAVGLLAYLALTGTKMDALITFITIVSFLLGPVIAIFNLLAVTGPSMPKEQRPGALMQVYCWAGIIALIGFGAWYLMRLI